jgi:hypothetical protein
MDDVYERKWDFVFYGKFTVKLISDIERLPCGCSSLNARCKYLYDIIYEDECGGKVLREDEVK